MKFLNSIWLDEIGIKFGVYRSDKETIEEYEDRIYLRISRMPEPTRKYFFEHIGNDALLKKETVFTISAKKVFNSTYQSLSIVPPSPLITIDGAWLKVWSNSALEPVLALNIWDKDKCYFLKDVYDELVKLEDFTVQLLAIDDSWMYKKSSNLISSTSKVVAEIELIPLRINKLGVTNITGITFGNSAIFANEVFSHEDLLGNGDYFINYYEGIVFSFSPAGGRCLVTYNKNPFEVMWHPVGVLEVNDASIKDIFKDKAMGNEGNLERLILNSQGANIINKILSVHPLQWGK